MSQPSEAPEPRDEAYRGWIFTIPNIICFVRLFGSLAMLVVAALGWRGWFVGMFVALTLSDWIDGKLARWLHQRSDFGARIDSLADFTLYACLILGTAFLAWDDLLAEWPWLTVAVGSYTLTTLAGLIKYGKVPSYHTFGAKKTQGLVLLAGVSLVLEWSAWPLRVAAIAATLTNLEATLLTWILPTWQADVSSLWKVLRDRRRAAAEAADSTVAGPAPSPPGPSDADSA